MTKVYYYLKRAQAAAKEEEFGVSYDLRAKKNVVVEKLFPLTISMLANLSRKIIKGEAIEEENRKRQLEVIAKFFVSYYNGNNASEYANYLLLLSSVAYYHIGQYGTSTILADKIDESAISQYGDFAVLISMLIKNKEFKNSFKSDFWRDCLTNYIDEYNKKYDTESIMSQDAVENLRKYVYFYGSDRDVLFVDVFLALAKLKAENSMYKILKKHSSLTEEKINTLIKIKSVFTEMWPAQRAMAEHGFFNGKSGVIQLPTGAGKTRAIALCIYSYQSAKNANISVVVAPFRALTREIKNDLNQALKFDSSISIAEVSDLLQDDYSIDIFGEKHNVIVVTPEKLLYIIEREPEFANEIGQIIFDEGHLFEDEHRGAKFELLVSTILFKTSEKTQKVLISAVVGGVSELKSWIAGEDGEIVDESSFFPAEKNVVALGYIRSNGSIFYKLDYLDINNNCNVDYYIPRVFHQVQLNGGSMFPCSPKDYSIALLLKLVKKDNCAIFCGTKPNANGILKRIVDLSTKGIEIDKITKRNNALEQQRISELIKQNYGDESIIYKAARLGVFVHHAGITDGIKFSMEYALRKLLITNVVCTSTLAQGVNIPIKYLIVSNMYQGGKRMTSSDFQNLVGRVGRPGMYIEGTIIFSNVEAYQSKSYSWDTFKNIFNVSKERCYSTLEYLCKTRQMRYDGVRASYYEHIISLYDNNKANIDEINFAIKQYDIQDGNTKEEWIETWKTILDILGNIEWFVANYEEQFNIQDIVGYTLAKNNLSESEGEKLAAVFDSVKRYICRLQLDLNQKKRYAKSMISSDTFLSIIGELNDFEISDELSNEDYLIWITQILKKYEEKSIIKKLEDEDVCQIVKWWMKGYSYKQILDLCSEKKIKILKRVKKSSIILDEIVSLCSECFGYSATLLLNVISDYYREKEETENWANYTDFLALQLKYGLPNKGSIFVYEIGFNDRNVAMRINETLSITSVDKNDVKKHIVANKNSVRKVLDHYPSYYKDVLNRL